MTSIFATPAFTASARRLFALAAACMFVLVPAVRADAQQVVVHRLSTYDEDGDPTYDSDAAPGGERVRNGVVVWASGRIHVVSGNFQVHGVFVNDAHPHYETGKLQVTSGAIVKFAASFEVDGQGNLTTWYPPSSNSGSLYAIDGSTIQIDGATLTDIRDDTKGGDTNQDFGQSFPGTPQPNWFIRFGAGPKEHVRESEIHYAGYFAHQGNIDIINNKFRSFCGIANGNYGHGNEVMLETVPVIRSNDFEINACGVGALDLRGQNAIVTENNFTGTGTAVRIGPQYEDPDTTYESDVGPYNGRTYVTNNHIETPRGIVEEIPSKGTDKILEHTGFAADITGNVLRAAGSPGVYGINVTLWTSTLVRDNTVSNYYSPLILNIQGVDFSSAAALDFLDLKVNHNRFSLEGGNKQYGGPSVIDPLWQYGVVVDAKDNWWGDASGPFDVSKFGLYNPLGKGYTVTNGIDYVPFVGGVDEVRDSITIDLPSLQPEADHQIAFDPTVAYNLKTANTGIVTLIARDENGQIVAESLTPFHVSSSGHSADLPELVVNVPKYSNVITIEAVLLPDGDGDPVRSNVEAILVDLPPSAIRLACIADASVAGYCPGLRLVSGTTRHLGLRFWAVPKRVQIDSTLGFQQSAPERRFQTVGLRILW